MTRSAPSGFAALQLRRLATGCAWTFFGVGGLLLSFTVFPVIRWTSPDRETRVRRVRNVISGAFRLFFFWNRVTRVNQSDTSGLAALKEKKGVLLVANHPTLIDYVLIASAIPQTDCLVKEALTRNFFLKRVVRAADYLVNSEEPGSLLRDASERLAAGDVLLIFPEGTRTTPGVKSVLRRGAAQIALRAGVPIEIISIECTETWLTKGAPWYGIPRREPRLAARFSGEIPARNLPEDEIPAAARELTREIASRMTAPEVKNNGI